MRRVWPRGGVFHACALEPSLFSTASAPSGLVSRRPSFA